MKRAIRKLLLVMILSVGGAVVFTKLKGRRSTPVRPVAAPEATWPPFEPRSDVVKSGAIGAMAAEAERAVDRQLHTHDSAADWVVPVDGACPEGYPIKANDNSHIFHLPGGRFYERTVAERCYATAEAAERDGYRQAKA